VEHRRAKREERRTTFAEIEPTSIDLNQRRNQVSSRFPLAGRKGRDFIEQLAIGQVLKARPFRRHGPCIPSSFSRLDDARRRAMCRRFAFDAASRSHNAREANVVRVSAIACGIPRRDEFCFRNLSSEISRSDEKHLG